MKNLLFFRLAAVCLLLSNIITAQSENENDSRVNVASDIYSNYIWRGTRFGSGPHVQPSVTFTAGRLTGGVWGSFDFNGYSEADPFLSIHCLMD